MSTITARDGVDIFYKDWGPKNAQPIFFHHGWPLSADDWDTQMLYFLDKGYRVIAHDRRGHGRSTQVSDGHDMDHYAADAAAVRNKVAKSMFRLASGADLVRPFLEKLVGTPRFSSMWNSEARR